MTMPKLPSAVLIAAAMFATPATARTNHVASRHPAEHANATAHHVDIDGPVRMREPRIGAFPPVPLDSENCDVGDNPFIC
jgi:hypothetical protein